MKKKPTKVYRYDGQSIWTSADSSYSSYSDYELGSYLGGGAAGVVYEAECLKTKRHLAVKVLNPIGYKLETSGSLRFCEVAVKGVPYGDVGGSFGGSRGSRGGQQGHGVFGSGGGGGGAGKMSEKHVWWLVNASTRQTIAAYYDARTGMLKEMTLPKCIEVWGLGDDKGRTTGEWGRRGRDRSKRERDRDRMRQEDRLDRVFVGGEWITIPPAPLKYDKFLRARASIFREISNMLQLSEHPNILRLHEALELVQDSKATIFLVLELARGGELFDRIKVDCGADEGAARHYFRQLLSGVRHCHDRGVCHRDLKPENLLLADPDDASVLKIADFGFSALFRELESESSSGEDSSGPSSSTGGAVRGSRAFPPTAAGRPRAAGVGGVTGGAGAGGAGGGGGKGLGRGVRRLKSVVGSPYYVAPEVLREESGQGYDGTKADVWSMGVILYAMLAGNLPFEKELLTCPRFAKFGAWVRQPSATASLRAHCSGNPKDAMDMARLDYPSWFFPHHFSFAASSLLSGLLHPDASSRLSVRQALRHPWVLNGGLYPGSSGSGSDGSEFSNGASAVRTDGLHDSDVPAPRQEPDPQNIPSELLGDDSDTEDEHEREGHLERKDARDDYRSRGGGGVGTGIRGSGAVGGLRKNRRMSTPDLVVRGQVEQVVGQVAKTQPQQSPSRRMSPDITNPPLPPSAPATPVAATIAAASNEMPTATAVVIGIVAEERIGEPSGGTDPVAVSARTGTVTVAAGNFTTAADDSAANTGTAAAPRGMPAAVGARGLGGIREEDSLHESDVEVDNDGGGPGVEAAPSVSQVSQGDAEQWRESCIPEPAPPPLPPTATRTSVPRVGGGTGGGGKEEKDVDLLAGRVNRISLLRAAAAAVASVGGGNEGVVGAAAEIARVLSGSGAASIGKKKAAATGSGGGGAAASGDRGDGEIAGMRGVTTSSVDVAAEAAEEEALAARQAAANKAAAVAAGLSSNAAKRTDASAEPPSNPPSPATPIQRRGSPSGGVSRSRMLDVFSSPPLAPVGAGRGVEDEESGFALDSGCPPLPPKRGRARSSSSSGREGLPPLGAEHRLAAVGVVGVGGAGGQRPLSTGGGPLSLGVAGMAMEKAAGDEGEVRREGEVVAVAPPAFHDLVKRSTRFMTSVPAALVLRKIATIINGDAHPLPYPYRNIKQKAVVHQDEYKLEIMRGGVLVCTVQIYLLGGEHRAAQYMVEFLRGQLDIFLFKRFYEDVRCKLNDLVKKDYSLALLESGTCTHRFRRFSNLA